VLEQRGVRNTSGITETRYVIREQLVLGEESWPIELTLTNRDALDRMLAAQAELNRLVLLTADPQLSTFPCRTLW
jgi:ribosomal protein S6--L-glutamate ligase